MCVENGSFNKVLSDDRSVPPTPLAPIPHPTTSAAPITMCWWALHSKKDSYCQAHLFGLNADLITIKLYT